MRFQPCSDKQIIDDKISKLMAIIDNADDLIVMFDRNGKAIFINRAGRQMMGVSPSEDLSALSIEQFYAPESIRLINDVGIPMAIKNGQWKGESELLARNGRRIKILQTLVAHFCQKKACTVLDQTSAQTQLDFFSAIGKSLQVSMDQSQQSLSRYQSLFNQTPKAVVVYQAIAQGNDFIVVDCNNNVQKIESVFAKELLGKKVSEIFPKSKSKSLLTALKRVWQSGKAEAIPLTFFSDERVRDWRENYLCRLTNTEVAACYYAETQFKQIEQQLYASEIQKQLILDYLPDLIWLKDINGVYLSCNPVFERFFGAEEHQIVGKTDYDFIDKQLADSFRYYDQFAINAAKPNTNQEWITFAEDGRTALLETTKTPLRDPDGRLLGVLGIGHDITDYKQHETQLKRSLSLLAATLESTDNAMLVVDNKRNVMQYNSIFKQLWQIPDEILEKQREPILLDFVLSQLIEPEQFRNKVELLYQYSEREDFSIVKFKDGRIYDQYTKPMFLEDKVVGRVWSFRDVTKQKQTENALRENEARFRSFFEKNSSVMLLIQPATGEIEAANEAAIKYYGYSLNELLAKRISQINMLPVELIAAERAAALQEKRNFFNFPHRLSNGEIRDVEVYSTPIRTNGQDLLFSIVHDITARREAEKSLEFHLLFQKNATEISIRFLSVNEENFDDAINLSLAQLGQLFMVDRSYLFLFSDDLNTMSNTHEWCAENVMAQIDRVQNFPRDGFPSLYQQIQSGPVHIPDVSRLPDDMREEREEWSAQNIQSLICIPVYGVHKQILGFIGFDAVKQKHFWPDEQIDMLQVLADIIGGAIERKRIEAELLLAASVFTNAREGIIITEPHGRIININDTFCHLSGYQREELLGKNLRMFKSRLQSKEFYLSLWDDLINKGHWAGELWSRKKNGKIYAQTATISAVSDSRGKTKHFVGLFSDITEQKQQQRQLEHIAHYDALTNLPNRILLADRLMQAMHQTRRNSKKLAVVYIDLDGFKEVNDSFGHDIGDKLLVSISRHMQENLRVEDTVSRLGGDEFVAVLINLNEENESIPLLMRLLESVSQPINIDQYTLQVSASLGVTFYPQKEEIDADQLLRQADQSMYLAKLSGKNRYQVFDETQARNIRVQHESVERIQQALKNKELLLYYQPKVNMRSGEVIGVEALLRWQHPELGLVPPMNFLPTIKNHPVAIEVDDWVINTALEQLTQWQQQGLKLSVSVNISPNHLQKDFTQQLQQILAKFPNVSPNLLELEVLESSAFEDIQQVSQLISSCRELGVDFALDDFGTGYSSLTYLQRLPASLLKIDQSFIRFILENPDDLAIVEAILSLAQAFRRRVIAEGVETAEHGDILLQMGCELGQGYGIARPMPAEQVKNWVETWQPTPSWQHANTIAREKFSILFFEIKHRSWVTSLQSYLQDKSTFKPELNHHSCLLGAWIENEGGHIYGDFKAFQEMAAAHKRIHKLAKELVRQKEQGASEAYIQDGVEKLLRLKDKITGKLRAIM